MTDGADTLERVWSRAVASLTDGELTHQQRAWLTLTRPLGLMEDTALLAAPNEFTQNMLETRLRPLITEALSAALGRDIRVAVTIESSPPPANPSPPPAPTDPNPPGHPASGHPASGHQVRSPFAPPGDQRDVSPPGDEPQLTYGETVDSRGEHRGEPVDRPVDSRGLRLVDNHYSLGPPGSDRLPPRDQPQDRRHDRDEPHQGPGLTVYEGGRSMDTDHAPPVDTGFGSSDSGPADYRSADHRERTGQITGQSIGRSSGVNEDTGWSGSPGPVRESGLDLGAPRSRPRSTDPIRLNPKYTFETFVIGSSNRFAHAAAVAVAEAPAKAYNPLFVYGESGLGKTHLLHAIGHYAHRLFPHIRVRYVSTEEFTNDFINLVHSGKAEDFRRRYRDVDVLLVDDIQFLERAERTQEEFFHTFNTLHNANKQIVITSDRPPKQLTTLEDRLRTRFEWGLITDVQAPDLETRIAILRKKAAQENLKAPADVLEFIATKIQSNIRELEGALIRVTAFASLNRQGVDVSLAEVVLKDLIPDSGGPEITAATIMAVTAEYFSVSIDDLCSMSRSRVLVTARQIAMYLCRELTDLSLPRIGQTFGGKDHTTVMHAVKKVSGLMAERRSIYNQVTELTNRIKARARQ